MIHENSVVLNSGKCHFMCLGKNTENEAFSYKNTEIENSKKEKMLGIIIDKKLKFKIHTKNV